MAAEDRAEVLERIAPIGRVAVEGQTESTAVEAPTSAAPVATSEAQEPATAADAGEEPVAEEAASAEETVAAVESTAAAEGGDDVLAIATANGCMACHQIENKVVGPAYKEVAAKYKDDAAAIDMLVNKVKAGGVGTWGQIPMPPNAHVSDENIRTIVQWVLSL
jgi:cytochrome c